MRLLFSLVNLTSLDLNLLVVLHTMLEDPSVARTAARLHVTPPAISNALARLRAQFDDPLFVRKGRGLVPTPRALELAPALARAIEEIETVVRGEAVDPTTTRRRLTLALDDLNQVVALPALVTAVSRHLPRARLDVISIDTLMARGGLEAGAADVTIAPSEGLGDLCSRALYVEEGVLAVRRGHPILKRKRVSPEALSKLRHVDLHLVLGEAGVGHELAEAELERSSVQRDVAVTVPSFVAAAMIAAKTDLAAAMPRRLLEALRQTAPLVVIEHAVPPMMMPMSLVWHRRTDTDPICNALRAAIVEAYDA